MERLLLLRQLPRAVPCAAAALTANSPRLSQRSYSAGRTKWKSTPAISPGSARLWMRRATSAAAVPHAALLAGSAGVYRSVCLTARPNSVGKRSQSVRPSAVLPTPAGPHNTCGGKAMARLHSNPRQRRGSGAYQRPSARRRSLAEVPKSACRLSHGGGSGQARQCRCGKGATMRVLSDRWRCDGVQRERRRT